MKLSTVKVRSAPAARYNKSREKMEGQSSEPIILDALPGGLVNISCPVVRSIQGISANKTSLREEKIVQCML